MNFELIFKSYGFILLVLSFFLLWLMRFVSKSNIDIKNQVLKPLFVAVFSMFFYACFLFSYSYKLSLFYISCFFLSLDWLLLSALNFIFSYTQAKTAYSIKIFAILSCIDSISLLLNIFFSHQLDLLHCFTKAGYSFWNIKFFWPHILHFFICCILIFESFLRLLYCTVKSPVYYRKKYLSILVFYSVLVVLNVLSYIFFVPLNFSVLLFGAFAIIIAFYSGYTFPSYLVNKTLSIVNDSISYPIFYFDCNGKFVFSNLQAKKVFVCNKEELACYGEKFRKKYLETKENEIELNLHGKEYIFLLEYKEFYFHNSIVGSYLKMEDITFERPLLKQKQFESTHDFLTGLLNRQGFFSEVEKRLKENFYENPIMLTSNIKDFRLINEIYGEHTGDKVLVGQATMMKVKAHPKNINGRLCDDKFVIFMEKKDFHPEFFEESFLQLKETLNDNLYKMAISVGVYEVFNKSENVQVMYDKAKMAMDAISDDYHTMFSFYDSTMMEKLIAEKNIISSFEQALDDMEFEVYYQPVMNGNGSVIGAEALVRWHHGAGKVLYPQSFINVLERTGLIYRLDLYVWEAAVRKIREWNQKGIKDIFISINISFRDKYFVDIYDSLIALTEKYNISPSSLCLEFQEQSMIQESKMVFTMFKKLKKAGFKVFIDGFGSGYSSLNMMKDFEADAIKVDANFLGEEHLPEKNRIILEAMMKMASELNMKVIAKKVETKTQINLLQSIGCTFFQGYYFSMPVMPKDFDRMFMKF